MSEQGTTLSQVGTPVDLYFVPALEKKSTLTFYIDLSNMESGDVIDLQASIQITTGGAEQAVINGSVDFDTLAPNDLVASSIPIVVEAGQSYRLTLNQTAGAAKEFPWRIADVPIPD